MNESEEKKRERRKERVRVSENERQKEKERLNERGSEMEKERGRIRERDTVALFCSIDYRMCKCMLYCTCSIIPCLPDLTMFAPGCTSGPFCTHFLILSMLYLNERDKGVIMIV